MIPNLLLSSTSYLSTESHLPQSHRLQFAGGRKRSLLRVFSNGLRKLIWLFHCSACVIAMDSSKGQGGIQMLLTAEQEAQQIVSSARNMKMKRLKQAKDEAEKEAANYRSSLEMEYQRKVSDSSGFSGSNLKRLEEETEKKINNLKSANG
ncbi:V-type proton ATPase subunit G-like protein [Cinnamomum micranthum f. kanehirae]|uniref:V-type proton ATPase subunit G n=1 Tax=Cinnamomum micranthum f. kanehirae TaxID=337451 RepID=A0A443N138_9MAGN|nr:V-type proton ATPase subunit G-like protein [Cinnamomum micranthum f. kanehirae]